MKESLRQTNYFNNRLHSDCFIQSTSSPKSWKVHKIIKIILYYTRWIYIRFRKQFITIFSKFPMSIHLNHCLRSIILLFNNFEIKELPDLITVVVSKCITSETVDTRLSTSIVDLTTTSTSTSSEWLSSDDSRSLLFVTYLLYLLIDPVKPSL